jgi:hypothetical protein
VASTLAPFGFKAVYHPSGQIRPSAGTILNNYSTAIYSGDPVSLTAAGVINVTASGVSNGLVGIFAGCEYTMTNGRRTVSPFWPGSAGAGATDIIAYYTTDPAIIYEIAADGTVPMSAIGEQTTFGLGTGNASTGQSGATLAIASLSSSTANQLRVVGLAARPDNAWGDTYTVVQVQIALHQFVNRQGPY